MFKSQKDLEERIKGFTDYCIEKVKPMTLERLAVFLDCDTETIRNYEKKDEFFGTIKAIRSLIVADKVERLNDKSTFTPGIVFDLKNNHDWKDKSETELTWKDGKDLIPHLTPQQMANIGGEMIKVSSNV